MKSFFFKNHIFKEYFNTQKKSPQNDVEKNTQTDYINRC